MNEQRLFVAVLFDKPVLDGLCNAMEALREHTEQGNFTLRENLHLTLVFIGETPCAADVRQAMDAVCMQPFPLKIAGLGRFRRDGGDICWAGVEISSMLSDLYHTLVRSLSAVGFTPENRPYTPHLTLGRKVVLAPEFDLKAFGAYIPELSMTVRKISLMKSERIYGKLTYTEIYSKALI